MDDSSNLDHSIPVSQNDTSYKIIDGKYYIYNENGKLKEAGNISNDSIIIYEQKKYYESGKIKEYNFFNPKGDFMFGRLYDEKDGLIYEDGSVLSHTVVPFGVIYTGDSIQVGIFVPRPPKTSTKVFGIDSEIRYLISRKHMNGFLYSIPIYSSIPGRFVFPFEVEMYDSISNKTYKVVDRINLDFVDR